MTDPRALLDQLIHIRTQTGVLQATVARRMGVSANAVSRLENDHARDPKLSTVTRYADALGVQLTTHNPKEGPAS